LDRKGQTVVNIAAWAVALAGKYPQVACVGLCGSRARGWERPDSDWDVVIWLDDSAYARNEHGYLDPIDQIEQRIAFDPAFRFEDLDLFFLRQQDHSLARWEWGPGNPPDWVLNEEDDDLGLRSMRLHGVPIGDFSRFYQDLKYARPLFERPDS
jgi:hypothetical protein